MTDAASKAREELYPWRVLVSQILEEYLPFEILQANSGDALVDALASAITAAQQAERTALAEYIKANGLAARTAQAELRAERERAGKLVEAASKAVKADAKREWGGDPEMQYLAECLDAYEVQP